MPKTIVKGIREILEISNTHKAARKANGMKLSKREKELLINQLTKEMKVAAKILDFENAAYLRDKIKQLQEG